MSYLPAQGIGGHVFKADTPDTRGLAFYMLNSPFQHTARGNMTKLTKQRTDIILSSIADGHSIVDVCEATGVSRTAFYQRCKRDEEFAAAVKESQQYSAEKALEELDTLYSDALHGVKDYNPHVLRDYAHHVRWKAGKVLPEKFGEGKNRTGVEVSDGTVRILWETDGGTTS